MGAESHTLALYLVAAVVYIAIGVFVPEFLLAWVVGVAYVLVAVWLLPELFRRLR